MISDRKYQKKTRINSENAIGSVAGILLFMLLKYKMRQFLQTVSACFHGRQHVAYFGRRIGLAELFKYLKPYLNECITLPGNNKGWIIFPLPATKV